MISQYRIRKIVRGYRRAGINGMRRATGLAPLRNGCQRPSASRNIDNPNLPVTVQSVSRAEINGLVLTLTLRSPR